MLLLLLIIILPSLALRKNGKTLVTGLSEAGGLNPSAQAVSNTLTLLFVYKSREPR